MLVFALALLTHLPVALQYRGDPFGATLVSDARSYDEWGRRIAANGLAQEPVFHQAPLFPLLLAGIHALVPERAAAGAIIGAQALLTSLAIALLVPIGASYAASRWAGFAGALTALLHGAFVFHSLKWLPVPLAVATQGGALVALAWARERASAPRALAAGALLGVAAMARAEMLLFAPVALAALARPLDPSARPGAGLRLAGLGLCGVIAGVAPATLHNLRQGDFVLVASSGGENLYIGNRRGAEGDYTPLHPQAGDLFSERVLAREIAEQAAGRALRASEVSSHWRREAVREIVADPAGWLALEARKLGRILHPGDPNDIYSLPLERALYLPFLKVLFVPPWLLLGAAALGCAMSLRARASAWPLGVLAATQVAVLLLFFVNTRLRLPLLYTLAPFAGVAVVEGVRLWRTRRTAVVVAGGLLLAAGAISAVGTRARPRDRVRLASVLSIQGRLEEALRAIEADLVAPEPPAITLDQAGWIHQKRGEWDRARERYRRALAAGMPGGRGVQTRTRLALVLEQLGELDAAAAEHDAAVADPAASAGTFFERALFRLRHFGPEAAVADLESATRLAPAWDAPRAVLERLSRPPDGPGLPSGRHRRDPAGHRVDDQP